MAASRPYGVTLRRSRVAAIVQELRDDVGDLPADWPSHDKSRHWPFFALDVDHDAVRADELGSEVGEGQRRSGVRTTGLH